MNTISHVAALAATSASDSAPAGGAAIGQVVLATTAAILLTAALLVLGLGHRTGRVKLLAWGSDLGSRISGLPPWVALPSGLAAISLLGALFGMMWDISLHIDQGRDEGPLANPAHYFILAGLFGVFSAGYLAMVIPSGRPSPTAIKITDEWHAPLGGVLITASASFSLIGFPLDDVWHRLFGQDVTLWGPTHLMLLGGAAMSLIGIAVLLVEGSRAQGVEGRRGELAWVAWLRRLSLTGAFLIGLSIFQAEFDFGVPQFRFIFEPMLIAFSAGVALVATRVWLGPGSALGAVAFFLVVRGGISFLVGPVLGEATPHFPLYVVEAMLVELAALVISTRRPLALGAVSGALIGTIGLAAEWGWSHVWMPIPWTEALLPEIAWLGPAMAICGGVIGAWMGAKLASDRLPSPRGLGLACGLAAVAVAAMIGYGLHEAPARGVEGTVRLAEVPGEGDRAVQATVALQPREAGEDVEWLTALAWQGGGLVVDHLEPIGPGVYRTTEPIPVDGTWKALIRLHDGSSQTAIPVYLPEDSAIPAEGVPASRTFTRSFGSEEEILQREQKTAAGWVSTLAYLVVLALALGFLGLMAWGLHRLAAAAGQPTVADRPAPRPDAKPMGGPAAATR